MESDLGLGELEMRLHCVAVVKEGDGMERVVYDFFELVELQQGHGSVGI